MLEINIKLDYINSLFKEIYFLKEIIKLYNLKYKQNNKLKFIFNKEDFLKKINNIKIYQEKYIKSIINDVNEIIFILKNINTLFKLVIKENNIKQFLKIKKKIENIEKKINKLEIKLLLSSKYDEENCYIDIQSGSGGIEAQDWSYILLKMYLNWAEYKGFKIKTIEKTKGEIIGIKSTTIHVIGNYAYGWFRTETGIHRLVRKSPFDSNHKRHTSFSSVFIYPDIISDIDIKINSNDLRIDFYRSSGAGGQHVNCTESAVRITHLPTGITSQCQNERSQHKNKNQALKQLKSKLYKLNIQKKNVEKKFLNNIKSNICSGNQIRSYVLDQSYIKDLRTGVETKNIKSILNGNLNKFIEASLKAGL